ncbi:MAG TPA: Ig-like domain-containing protein [Prolixibacteraceae bacterium]|nr:Ig-like domain-containing protein [Prolixibacteraceae bacterium]
MKKIVFIVLIILFGYASYCQTGLVENFEDGNLTGWSGQPDYKLSNVGGELKIVTNKTAVWNSFQFVFLPIDISSHPYVSIKVKTDIDFNLNFSVWDNTPEEKDAYPVNDTYQTVIGSEGYTTYTFDFRNITGVDLTRVAKLNFVFNPGGSKGCNSTVYFDDIQIGDQALVMPAITRIPDQVHPLNAGKVVLPFWGIKDRSTGNESLTVAVVSSNKALIPDPAVVYTHGNTKGTLEYTPVQNQTGTAFITVTVSGRAPDDNVYTFKVTVEPNRAPKVEQVTDQNLASGKQAEILLPGLDDGDASASQSLTVSATSSNPSLVPNPVVEYTNGEFNGKLKLTPAASQKGTAVVKVTVKDNGGILAEGIDTTIMTFNVTVYDEVNNPPAMNSLVNVSVLQDSPEQTVSLRGITDGDDDKVQGITISAVSSNQSVIPDPSVVYLTGTASGELKFTPAAGQTGNTVITVTLTDNGGNENNNGHESVTYTFNVEVRPRPIAGWEDEFNDGILGSQWPATWGDPGENTHMCSEADGVMQIQVDKTRTNNMWAGLWFNIPTEIDLSKNPYISITMRTDQPPKPMLIFLWDAYNHYNTAKTVRYTVTGSFVEYYFDYSDPSFQLQGDGTKVDFSRIKALLINFDPGGSAPLFKGSFFFDDFRVGDKAHRAAVTPKVTMDELPDFAIEQNSALQKVILSKLTDGAAGSNVVTLTATSSNTNLIPHPEISAVVNQSAELAYRPVAGQTGTATITVTASANGSTSVVKTFKVIVKELNTASATGITIELNKTYQEIDGFGAFMGSGGADPDTIIALAKDIGMSMARFGVIGGGFETVNDNSDPKVINLDGYNPDALSILNMQRIAPFVDKFIVTFWSPAGWMKLNKWEDGVENWATDNKLDPNYYEEYAEEVVALIKVIKRETGKDVYGIGLQNEPQFNEPYPSCQVNPAEFRDMIKVVGKRLDDEGYGNVQLFWAEALPAQGAIKAYIDLVKDDPVAKQYADIVAIHNYDADGASVGGAGCDYWSNIYNWAQAGDTKYKTWMTETSGHADTWDGAMTLAGNIFNALHCGNASGWAFWSFSVSEGSPEYGLVVGNRPTSRYYVSKQFYKFIRPGAVRVDVEASGIPVMAYKDDKAKTVSVILFNNTAEAQTIQVKGKGLPSQWESYTTSRSRNCEKGSGVGQNGLILLPPSSVTTLVGDNSNPPPTIDPVSDIIIEKNSGNHTINLTGIGDGEALSQDITIMASSDNPDLIPDPTVSYTNGQVTGVLSYAPVANKIGSATITLTLTDHGSPAGYTTEQFTITVKTITGIESMDSESVSMYPNPTSKVLNITLDENSENTLVVTDAAGKMRFTKAVSASGEYRLDVSKYAKGVYLLTLTNGNGTHSAKFVVE